MNKRKLHVHVYFKLHFISLSCLHTEEAPCIVDRTKAILQRRGHQQRRFQDSIAIHYAPLKRRCSAYLNRTSG